jgi:multicomponent Na+:H+ antiporter subunit D
MLAFFGPVMFIMAAASILFGGLGAVGRDDIESMLAFSSIGQVGFIVLPLAIAATVTDPALQTLGIAAALVYSFNHGLAKGLLFLTSATVDEAVGSVDFRDLGGLASRAPVLAAAFLIGGLSLVGVPPLIGFFGKFLVFDVAVEAWASNAAGAVASLAVALLGAILTIAYITRSWNAVFWGATSEIVAAHIPTRWERPDDTDAVAADGGAAASSATTTTNTNSTTLTRDSILLGEVVVVVALAVAIIGFGIGFEAVFQSAQAAANAALDWQAYVDAVNPAGPDGSVVEVNR